MEDRIHEFPFGRIRFTANSVMNAQAKDMYNSFPGYLASIYGNFYVRCEEQGAPSGDA